jgi:uncharacterized protein (DUF2141 family)
MSTIKPVIFTPGASQRRSPKHAYVLALLSAWAFAHGAAHAQVPAHYTLDVQVLGLQSSQGQVIANLFKEGDDVFGTSRAKQAQAIDDKHCTLRFANLEAGRYAVVVFHDINGNNDLDHNVFRFPAEPLGFSNGFELSVFSGMPDSHKLAFDVGPNTKLLNITVK